MNFSDQQIISKIIFFFLVVAIPVLLYCYYRFRAERKQTDKLNYLLENCYTIINNASDGVIRCDLEGKFLFINNAAARMLGFRSGDHILSSCPNFSSNFKVKEEFRKIISISRKRGNIFNYPIEAITLEGKSIDLELIGNSISSSKNGSVVGFEGILREIGDPIKDKQLAGSKAENLFNQISEKSSELLVLEQDKMQMEKLMLLGEMAAVIVHEIRNPLSSIKIGLSTLEKRAGLESRDLSCLQIAYDEVKALERILDELLDFAKPMEFNPRLFGINAIIKTSLQQRELEFQQSSVEIKTDLAESLPPGNVDVDKLIQVLQNIYLNAIHAMPEGGSLLIDSRMRDRGIVEISITDSGVGMSENDLEKIYEPFFSRREGGTGLGMTIVEKIITAHSGSVEVKSDMNQGTTVKIKIPVQIRDIDS